mgnify:CR=1 FL=1
MAIYHLSTKPISRSSGRTATASIAYRAGIAIKDERTGKEHDYTRKGGVVSTRLHTPNNLDIKRDELWNLAEASENRKNSRTAREIVVNLPYELSTRERVTLVNDFAEDLASKYGVAVDVAVHLPDAEGDNRNHHAHIMLTTRKLERLESGRIALTDKSQLEMSNTQLKERNLPTASDELKLIRKQWADMTNERLEHAQIDARIDHRSHAERGLDQLPTQKLGWEASAMERKGIATDKGDYNRMVKEYNQTMNQVALLDKSIQDLKAQREQSNDRVRKAIDQATRHVEFTARNTTRTAQNTDFTNQVINGAQQQTEAAERAIDQADRAIAEHQRKLEAQAVTPPPQQIKKQSEVTAVTELSPNTFKENRKIFTEYAEKVETTAKAILRSQLKALEDKGKPLLAKFEKLRDNEPLLWFKKEKWAKDKENALKAFDAVKDKHNSLNDKGVTEEHREQAKQHIAEREPSYHAKAQQAIEILSELNRVRQDNKAKQHGADFHAQQGKTYSGKILRADENGIVQQTRDGTVYHPAMSGIERGKSYNLENNGSSYKVQQQYEVRKPDKSLDQDRGMVR